MASELPAPFQSEKSVSLDSISNPSVIQKISAPPKVSQLEVIPSDNTSIPPPEESKLTEIRNILRNQLFVSIMLTLITIFFVAFSIQFWYTSFMIEILNQEKEIAHLYYFSIMLTCPTTGVVLGGYISDRLGGYKGVHMFQAIKICFIINIGCVLLAIPGCFPFDIFSFIIMMSLTVILSACQMPVLNGVLLSSLPVQKQSVGSGLNQLFTNFFGYFLSPIYGGFIMDNFKSEQLGMLWGYRASLVVMILTIFFLGNAIRIFPSFRIKH